jgi:ATP-dependent Clp protease adaptor protein ClpS
VDGPWPHLSPLSASSAGSEAPPGVLSGHPGPASGAAGHPAGHPAGHHGRVPTASPIETLPVEVPETTPGNEVEDRPATGGPWQVVVWDDPINLMTYVTYVFQKLFGYDRPTAERLMLKVHHEGRAVVASGPRERAELDVHRLHAHGLWATLERPA